MDCGAKAMMSTPKRDEEKLPVLWIRRGGKLVKACGGCSPCRRGRYSKCEAPQSAELVYAGQQRHFSSPVMTQEEAARITRERLGIEESEAAYELADAAIARRRIAEIEANPDRVLRGKALEKKLLELQAVDR